MSSYSNKTGKRKYIVALAILLLVGGAVSALELTDTTHLFHKKERATTATSYTKGSTPKKNKSKRAGSDQASRPASSQTENQKSVSSGGATSGVAPAKPSGDFVSNHHPSLGSSAQSLESSVCNTTPGAKCVIVFIKDGQTKSLPGKLTDSGGSAYWDWRLQDIGLTAGSWKIKVAATLNGQTKTAYDAQNLEVSQ